MLTRAEGHGLALILMTPLYATREATHQSGSSPLCSRESAHHSCSSPLRKGEVRRGFLHQGYSCPLAREGLSGRHRGINSPANKSEVHLRGLNANAPDLFTRGGSQCASHFLFCLPLLLYVEAKDRARKCLSFREPLQRATEGQPFLDTVLFLTNSRLNVILMLCWKTQKCSRKNYGRRECE